MGRITVIVKPGPKRIPKLNPGEVQLKLKTKLEKPRLKLIIKEK